MDKLFRSFLAVTGYKDAESWDKWEEGGAEEDFGLTARNMTTSGSQRIGDTEWNVDGGKVVVAHAVTGREYGQIDLSSGEVMPVRPQDRERVKRVADAIHREAAISKVRQELATLRDYPIKNQERIATILKKYPTLERHD